MDSQRRNPEQQTGTADLGGELNVRQETLQTMGDARHLLERVDNQMRVLGYGGKDLFAVQLSLGEAIINAFRHGNDGDPSKVVRVVYLVTADEVVFEVEDEGPGFDPTQVPDPRTGDKIARISCRGLYLMRVYMSGVIYNRKGNRVTLCRRRSQS